MASGNVGPGTGAPAQQPYQPQMMPMYGQPYVQPKPAMDIAEMLKKRILLVLVLVGALLLLIGKVVTIYATDANTVDHSNLLRTLGAFVIAASSVVWALGSKRTSDWQNLGLLILAAMLMMVFG